jgi:Dolichyl-phosphate-mannose-protein mannosyltransferase
VAAPESLRLRPAPAVTSDRVPALAWVIAAAFVCAELAVSDRYGFMQDELYFIVAGRHLVFGYVDQPPLTPLVTRAVTSVLGVSPVAVRIVPALAGGAIVAIAARLAALFGAGQPGRVLAALTTACAPLVVGYAELGGTPALEMLAWAVQLDHRDRAQGERRQHCQADGKGMTIAPRGQCTAEHHADDRDPDGRPHQHHADAEPGRGQAGQQRAAALLQVQGEHEEERRRDGAEQHAGQGAARERTAGEQLGPDQWRPAGLAPAPAGSHHGRSLFSTTTVIGTPLDVTINELAIEAFYPADQATADALQSWATAPAALADSAAGGF